MGTAARLLRFVFPDARHHFRARGLGCGLHHVTAWWLAEAAPNRLATHGQRLGTFAGIGFKAGHHHHVNVLLGEALDVLHEAFFI
jgi:hypothetical protein